MNGQPLTSCHQPSGAGRGLGANLLLLLGLPVSARVLILGAPLRGWRKFFGRHHYRTGTGGPLPTASYDLVLYHVACAGAQEPFPEQLATLRQLLVPTGRLLIFASNNNSPLSWLARGGKTRRGPTGYGVGDLRRALAAAGFTDCREFKVLPDEERVEELVVPDSAFFEFSNRHHPWLHLARRWRVLPTLASSCFFLEGAVPLEQGPLLQAVTELSALPPGRAETPEPGRLERIDFRQRGALILFMVFPESERKIVARVVADSAARAIVRRNRGFLQTLHEEIGLPEPIKALLPKPLGETMLDGRLVQVETLLPGLPAWKVRGPQLTRRIYPAALDFIWQLQLASRVEGSFSGEFPASLFAPDLARLKGCPTASAELQRQVFETASGLCRRLSGRSGWLVASHGDYGYGNILADPQRGRLQGVIDWDTGRLRDLPGLDLLNLEVQRLRTERNLGVFAAFCAAAQMVLMRRGLDAHGAYAAHFGVGREQLPRLLHASLLRYLCRAAGYPEVLAGEAEDYLRVFDFLREVAPL